MRKALVKLEKEVREPVQRNNLSITSYKTRDRVCKVIIDNGSIDSLVSTEMVEKLKLEMTGHLNLYKVSWLQKGNQVMVTRKCKVEFKIGGYRDAFLCDVIPMDVCHVRLGIPFHMTRMSYMMGGRIHIHLRKMGVRICCFQYKIKESKRNLAIVYFS
jgi:hypothetical protein